jgi:sulfite dehydrogenase (quinone) subunit SoeC
MAQTTPRREAVRAAALEIGCGLLALTGLFSASGLLPSDRWFGLCALGVALAALGLGATISPQSGAPTDAWVRRLRLTWLAASATGILFVIGWAGFDNREGLWRWFGLFGASFSAMTVYCMAMIHACREELPGWSSRWTVPGVLSLALLTGVLWLNAISHVFDAPTPQVALVVVVVTFLAFYVKRKYWRLLDLMTNAPPAPEFAGHRRTTFLCLFVFPLLLTLIGMGKDPLLALSCTVLAALSATGGLIAERWLFLVEGPTVQLPPTPPEITESD